MTVSTSMHSSGHSKPRTLGELKRIPDFDPSGASRSVKNELRRNLLRAIEKGETLFPSVHGYEDTVIPQIVNALLSRHNFILLGLRGQAKSRILRGLINLLDPEMPVVGGCEINDDPFKPICRACREKIASEGDDTPVAWMPRENRFVEKLATPDVTMALTSSATSIPSARPAAVATSPTNSPFTTGFSRAPIAASSPSTSFPTSLGRFRSACSTSCRKVTSKLRAIRCVSRSTCCSFSPRTPRTTRRGAKSSRPSKTASEPRFELDVPPYLRQVVEEIAFQAREDKRVDRRSGVSQRLPITTLESLVSSAEQRAARNGEKSLVARVADVYAALPAITGKMELEYEGELKGADTIARELIRTAVGRVFSKHFTDINFQPVIQWFELGGELKLPELATTNERFQQLSKIQGLMEHIGRLGVSDRKDAGAAAAAAEMILEGLWAHRRIGRSEERGFYAEKPRQADQREREGTPRPPRRQFN